MNISRTARVMRARPGQAVLMLALLGGCTGPIGGTRPPALPADETTSKVTLTSAPADSIRLGAFDVQFGKTTLDEVRRAVSAGEVAHQGDAGASMYWLCYTDVHSTPGQRLWIISDGEMGGPEHRVTGASAQLLGAASTTGDCPALPDKLTPLSTNHHVWLGSSASDALGAFGLPSSPAGPWLWFDYKGTTAGKCAGGRFDYLSRLVLGFEDGRATTLHVREVTSC